MAETRTTHTRWKYAEEIANDLRKGLDHRHVAIVTRSVDAYSDSDTFEVVSSDEPLVVVRASDLRILKHPTSRGEFAGGYLFQEAMERLTKDVEF